MAAVRYWWCWWLDGDGRVCLLVMFGSYGSRKLEVAVAAIVAVAAAAVVYYHPSSGEGDGIAAFLWKSMIKTLYCW